LKNIIIIIIIIISSAMKVSSLNLIQIFLLNSVFLLFAEGYSQKSPQQRQQQSTIQLERRSFLVAAATATTASILPTFPEKAGAVISSKYCAYGEGDGCDDLAEGNPLILELQRKSSTNKETIQKEARNAFYMKNYPDWFASVGKTMVKKPDGTFMVVDDAELAELKSQNKIGIEYAKAMGGKVTDLTQKPIMVLKE
jgi:hypothetical protein